jgi:probable F420-dependent oxidoreductase
MKLGLFGINVGPCADPDGAVRAARAAEEAGLESLWTGEHVVLPDPQAPPSPAAPETPFLDPTVALTYVAAATERIRLGTGIIILPQRNPLVLAKELASLDVLSRGRLLFGFGIGYLEAEFRALGIPFTEKGPRAEDYLAAMIAVWTQPKPEHTGRYAAFSGIQAMPRPVQRPHPPIHASGMTRASLRRAVRLADGWYGFALDVAATARSLEGLREARAELGRPAGKGELEISVTPRERLDASVVERYAELGVHRLIVFHPGATVDDVLRSVEATAALLP